MSIARANGARYLGGARDGEVAEEPARSRPRIALWQGYLALGAIATFLYMVVPPFKGNALLINLIGMTAWIAVVVGIRRNKPARPLPWWLFAGGLCLYWMGDVYTYSYPTYILHHEVPFPSVGDAIYLTVYPALMVGLLIVVRRRNPGGNRNTLIDATILTLGLSLLSWILLITPYLHDPTLGLLPKMVSVAYPLGDILLLAATVRLLLDRGPRQPAFYMLGASIVSLLITDFVYGLMTLNESFHHQLLLDLGWISFLLLWGTAALHPSMKKLQDPITDRDVKLTHTRLALLTGASLIAPGLHPGQGAEPRRLRPDRHHLRLDHPVRPRRHTHGGPGPPAGALGLPRAPAQHLRLDAGLLRDPRGHAPGGPRRGRAAARRRRDRGALLDR